MKQHCCLQFKSLVLLACLMGAACGQNVGAPNNTNYLGGSEATNPTIDTHIKRVIKGDVVDASRTQSACQFDRVVALDNLGTEQASTTLVDSQESFTLSVPINQIYQLYFLNGKSLVGTLQVDNGLFPLEAPFFYVNYYDNQDMDLGSVYCKEDAWTPERQPAMQNDADADGVIDYLDEVDNAEETTTTAPSMLSKAPPPAPDSTDLLSAELTTFDTNPDPDGDGVFYQDNCPEMSNPDQADDDQDGVGNYCEPGFLEIVKNHLENMSTRIDEIDPRLLLGIDLALHTN